MLFLFISLAACNNKAKQAEEADKKEAVKIDSLNTELNRSTEELKAEGDSVEKAVDDLLKD